MHLPGVAPAVPVSEHPLSVSGPQMCAGAMGTPPAAPNCRKVAAGALRLNSTLSGLMTFTLVIVLSGGAITPGPMRPSAALDL